MALEGARSHLLNLRRSHATVDVGFFFFTRQTISSLFPDPYGCKTLMLRSVEERSCNVWAELNAPSLSVAANVVIFLRFDRRSRLKYAILSESEELKLLRPPALQGYYKKVCATVVLRELHLVMLGALAGQYKALHACR